jgi:hypothetical protein
VHRLGSDRALGPTVRQRVSQAQRDEATDREHKMVGLARQRAGDVTQDRAS